MRHLPEWVGQHHPFLAKNGPNSGCPYTTHPLPSCLETKFWNPGRFYLKKPNRVRELMQSIRVLVVDDTEPLLDIMSRVLRASDDFEVVGTERNGLEAVTSTRELQPDVAIMEPKMKGLEAAKCIKQTLPNAGILFVSASNEYYNASIAVGGDVYLIKPFNGDELLQEVRRIALNYRRLGR